MIAQTMQEIEEGSICRDLMWASTPRTLLYRLENNSALNEARHTLSLEPDNASLFLKRAEELYGNPVEPGYSHPKDIPLAAYLYLIGRLPNTDVQDFIHKVAHTQRPEFRWASSVAKYLIAHTSAPTSAAQLV